MQILYRETRISLLLIGLFVVFEAMVILIGVSYYGLAATASMCVVPMIVFLAMFSLQVVLDDQVLFISYGIGLFSRTIYLETVQKAEIVPNTFMTWMYDPGLSHVLRLTLRNGGSQIVGIGDAKRLQDLIMGRIRD